MSNETEAGYQAYLDEYGLDQPEPKPLAWQSGWLEGAYEASQVKADTWHVTVTNAADALPLSEPDIVSPDTLGRWDAEEGRPCRPKTYYVARGKCALYALGYLEVQPDNADALAWVTDDEDAIELDYQWIREGGA